MKINDTMHDAQVAILHVLLFRPAAGFSELQKASGLSGDHFNFHLKQLAAQQVIRKNTDGHYELTVAGKEYANRFDTDERVVERQPKVAVLLLIEHDDGRFLYQQRLKQPFYGFWGRPTGKVRWGETILQAAARELQEEAGLTADLQCKGVFHKIDFNKDSGALLEDKIFFAVHGTHPRGNFIADFDGGHNEWLTLDEVTAKDKVFGNMREGQELLQKSHMSFEEKAFYYSDSEY